MANVLNVHTMEYKKSVNTTEYMNDNWLINPDLSSIQSVEKRFWKIDGNNVVEMSEEEKQIIINQNLPGLISLKIKELWEACFSYQSKFYTEPIFTRMSEMKKEGDSRIIEVETWINNLWNDYYTRRYMANHATSVQVLDEINSNYENNGSPPYMVADLLGVSL